MSKTAKEIIYSFPDIKINPMYFLDENNNKMTLSPITKTRLNKKTQNYYNPFKLGYSYRINTEVENLTNKLYNSHDKNNEFDTLVLEKPYYYKYVLNKKAIKNLKLYISNREDKEVAYQQTETLSPKRKSLYPVKKEKLKKNEDKINLKELQRVYFDMDKTKLPNIKNKKYNYENYASNKNIFNHPKLYILQNNERYRDNKKKVISVNNKPRKITLRLEYEKKKTNNYKYSQLFYKYLFS